MYSFVMVMLETLLATMCWSAHYHFHCLQLLSVCIASTTIERPEAKSQVALPPKYHKFQEVTYLWRGQVENRFLHHFWPLWSLPHAMWAIFNASSVPVSYYWHHIGYAEKIISMISWFISLIRKHVVYIKMVLARLLNHKIWHHRP